MKRRLNSCREYRETVSLLASNALPAGERAVVRDHLAHCAPCRQYYDEMATLSGELHQWAQRESPVQAGEAFRARWMRSIQTADAPTRISLAALMSRWGEWLWPSPLAWGALAAVWVCLLSIQCVTPVQHGNRHQLAGGSPNRTTITFAQRQQELTSVLDSLAPPPLPRTPNQPRPRTQRRIDSIKA